MFGGKIMQPLLALVLAVSATAAEWGTNYEAALAQAGGQGKAVLADFTGSDWCYYCVRLRKDVLEYPAFSSWAEQNFVLLEVDVPQNPNFDPELLGRNRELCARYKIDGYPTVLVLDARGRALGGLFGYESDPAVVRGILEKGLQADKLLRRAGQLEGEARLRCMLDAWKLIPEELRELNALLKHELAALDTQDVSGLRAEAEAERRFAECKAAADAAPTDAAALVLVNAALEQAVPQNRRQLLELKYRLLILGVQTPEDVHAAAEVAYAIIDADLRLSPQVKESRKKQLRGVFANPNTSINRSRMIRRKRPAK